MNKATLDELIRKARQEPSRHALGTHARAGLTSLGALAGGSIPILLAKGTFLAVIGFGAAPVALAGAMAAGGAALVYGGLRAADHGSRMDGTRNQILARLEEQSREWAARERAGEISDAGRHGFYQLLARALEARLVGPNLAADCAEQVEGGRLPITTAIERLRQALASP